MKLIKRTYIETFFWLIPVMLFGSILSFLMIKYIVYEETDEHLTYEMDRLVKYHAKHNDLPEFHKVENIIEGLKLEHPVFKDTLILEEHDNEMIPYRELWFSIEHDETDFTIVLQQLLPGNDDILEGSFLLMLGLLVLISLALFIMVKNVSGKLWKPFYKTINTLSTHKITEPVPHFQLSKIDEFNELNRVSANLLHKITNDFNRTKEFNENASHELQTHLAIMRANADKLLNSAELTPESVAHVKQILDASIKLSKAQKSLLLLSKIGNLEFKNNNYVPLHVILDESTQLFAEVLSLRNITLTMQIEPCTLFIDQGLLEILVKNLVKNAIKHNNQDGYIHINLNQKELIIENSGAQFEGSTDTMFDRFSMGKTGNMGLGLAIVKQICDIYQFEITYTVQDISHKIRIKF